MELKLYDFFRNVAILSDSDLIGGYSSVLNLCLREIRKSFSVSLIDIDNNDLKDEFYRRLLLEKQGDDFLFQKLELLEACCIERGIVVFDIYDYDRDYWKWDI